MSWFNKEFKYNFFAELPISSMCLILASCTINKAYKRLWWGRDKGVTQFQTWGHRVTVSNLTGLYVSTHWETTYMTKERRVFMSVCKKKKCPRSVQKGNVFMIFFLSVCKGKMNWLCYIHKLHSHGLHIRYLVRGNIFSFPLRGSHLAWSWQGKTTHLGHSITETHTAPKFQIAKHWFTHGTTDTCRYKAARLFQN